MKLLQGMMMMMTKPFSPLHLALSPCKPFSTIFNINVFMYERTLG